MKENAEVMELSDRRDASQMAPECLARCSFDQKHVAGEIGRARDLFFCSCVTVPPMIKIGMIVPNHALAVHSGAVERLHRLSPKIAERCELAAGAFAKIES